MPFLLLSVIHFWWFEFGLSRIETWTFPFYFFVLSYAALFVFICAMDPGRKRTKDEMVFEIARIDPP